MTKFKVRPKRTTRGTSFRQGDWVRIKHTKRTPLKWLERLYGRDTFFVVSTFGHLLFLEGVSHQHNGFHRDRFKCVK